MFKLKFPILCLLGLAASQMAFSQSPPVCASQAADPDGDGFGFENGASCIVTSDSAGPPEFVNQQTGNPVNLVRAYWDGLTDFNNPVRCIVYIFNSSTNTYAAASPSQRGATLTFSPLSTSAPYVGTVVRQIGTGTSSSVKSWSMDNGIYTGPTQMSRSPYFEIINLGSRKAVRSWRANNQYWQCAAVNPNLSFAPTGRPYQPPQPPEPQGCVDSPPIGDGWGWDGSTSCRVTGAREPTGGSCVDTPPAGDGWGWNGSASCRVTADPGPESSTCVDTAPEGDGWGWNGSASCRVTGVRQPSGSTCIDSPPLGDGWGWDGSSSCRVGAREPVSNSCIDSPPLGDGWGWNGSASCRI